MADTNRLGLPYIAAAQAQKHVPVNEALRLLDGLVQMSVISAVLTAPPGSPPEGACYIVAAGATGAWDDWDGDVAMFADGAWYRLQAVVGMQAWDQATSRLLVYTGASWAPATATYGPTGSSTALGVQEQLLSGLSGATVTSSIVIPNRSICLGVSSRTVTTITGATSYDCGISGESDKFGGGLGVAAGSTNKGVIGPQAFYADTDVVLTANGGNFTGGAVRIAIHYMTVGLPG